MPPIEKEDKEKRSVITSIAAIVLIIVVFLWRFIFSHTDTEYIEPANIKVAPNIDFEYLGSEEFEYFERYRRISPLSEEDMGRENPFISH